MKNTNPIQNQTIEKKQDQQLGSPSMGSLFSMKNLFVDTLNYELSRDHLLAAVTRDENTFFLEDTSSEKRFTIASVHIERTFSVKNQIELLKLENQLNPLMPQIEHLPFSGGLIGLLDFEFSYEIHGLNTALENRHPESKSFFHLIHDFVVVDHTLRQTHFISIKKGEDRVRQMQEIFTKPSANGPHTNFTSTSPPSSAFQPTNSTAIRLNKKRQFEKNFKHIKNEIRHGNLFQCVISEKKEATFHGSVTEIIDNLCRQNQVPYVFLLKRKGQLIAGASPERLIEVDQNRIIKTSPIAGTRPRSSVAKKDRSLALELIRCEKERSEHLMLVDLSRNDIGRVSKPNTVRVKKFQELKKYDHVMHLVSEVQGELEDHFSPLEAMISCFPAGTLSGAPKREALKNIRLLETSPRLSYGGAITLFDNHRRLQSFIVIRSLEANHINTIGSVANSQYQVHYRAGAGIVHDSRLSDEYKEIQNKSKTVEKAISFNPPNLEKFKDIGG